ncbi:Asp-tRNA(Asn)/Glu-tRNA(Gln) amidotransferase subunit GatA [Patescibacteria group bacterium]
MNLSELSIKKAHKLLQSGDISARELASAYLDNIKKDNKDLNVYLEVFDDVLEQAEEADQKIKSEKELPILAGIPMAIKDNMLIKGRKCSAGSKILEGFVAPYGSTAVEKLKKEGVVFLGRTNMDEFGMGSSTEHSAYGATKNPYDKERVPGGSSGGSAAAVASQMCMGALGSDTGSSVRQPAGFCNIVGLKPTYGSVSRSGLIAFASSLEQIGPLAKTVEDAEIIYNAIKGKDSMDATSVGDPISNRNNQKLRDNNQSLTIGVPKEFFNLEGENEGIEAGVEKNIKEAISAFRENGIEVKQVSLPSLEYAIETYYIIMPAEASSNLARFDGVKYGLSKKGDDLLADYMQTRKDGFGDEVRRRILLGTYVLSAGYYDAYYNKAQKIRNLMRQELKKTFEDVNVLLCPTSPTLPFKIGERVEDPIKMYLADIFTTTANLTGVPAISIPAGLSGKLPVGLQLMAPWFCEKRLFELGKKYETLH